MARNWIVMGDPTSSGGQVITASNETDIMGMGVARIGDKATCPKLHKGIFPIVDGDITILVDGQPVALHGCALACGVAYCLASRPTSSLKVVRPREAPPPPAQAPLPPPGRAVRRLAQQVS